MHAVRYTAAGHDNLSTVFINGYKAVIIQNFFNNHSYFPRNLIRYGSQARL